MAKITGLPAQNVINNPVSQDAKPAAGASSSEEVKPAVTSADNRPHSGNAANFWRSRISPSPLGLSEPEAAGSSSRASQARPVVKTGNQKRTSAFVSRLLSQKTAIPLEWASGSGPLPGTPDLDWQSVKPTGKMLGSGDSAWVLGFKAMRRDGPAGRERKGASGTEVRLAAKILKEPVSNKALPDGAKTVDTLTAQFNAYRSIIEAKHHGKPLGTHPNLCEIYGIATMDVDGVPMRAMLMEAVPGRDVKATVDALRQCMDKKFLNEREFWGTIQHLCDGALAAAEHLEKAGILPRDLKQENVLVGKNGTVKVINYGFASRTGDKLLRGSDAYMSALRQVLDAAPGLPDAEDAKNLIIDGTLGREEVQAIIKKAFELADIEGKRGNSTRWLSHKEALSITKHSNVDEPPRMTSAGSHSSAEVEKELAAPLLSAFRGRPNFENYLTLQRYFRDMHGHDREIEKILRSLPAETLEALNQDIAQTVGTRGKALLAKGSWLTGLDPVLAAGIKGGVTPSKQVGSKETAIETALKSIGKSIEDLNAYIAEAGRLFVDLKAISHHWRRADSTGDSGVAEVNKVGNLTKLALNLKAEHLGLQQIALLHEQRQGQT